MARPREFDEDRAMDAAMRAFWRSGYEATSTQDLCAATGLGRSSIYNTFHSKHALFERALTRYMTARTDAAVTALERSAPIHDKLRELLWETVDPPADDPVGCLVVNSLVELAPRDEVIGAALTRDQTRRHEALRAALAAARSDRELPKTANPEALAHFVMATISGMRVMARGGADRNTLAAVAETALTAI
ncbi:TetR/AcrR family transcriptional regulator [Actinophytocola sp.]|uniref:TetR/AcrR family transcriptional regulator n=1 Tax=Actinophytocola sp. TaxID=1872138 RepID=UPI002ED12202